MNNPTGIPIFQDVLVKHILLFGVKSQLSVSVYEDETIEDLQLKGLRLIQKKEAFRFGMDSVLLAHFAQIRADAAVADFGSGNGVLPILLHGRNKGSVYYAFEIQEEAACLAERNVLLNGLEEKVHVFHNDVKHVSSILPNCSMDAVICNPPYGQPSSVLTSPNDRIAVARSQKADTLDCFFAGAFSVLKGKGKISLVYPAAQMLFVMEKLQQHHLEPKRFQLVYPTISKPANLVLVEAVKDARPTLHTLPPLVVYEEDGSLTNSMKSVYHMT